MVQRRLEGQALDNQPGRTRMERRDGCEQKQVKAELVEEAIHQYVVAFQPTLADKKAVIAAIKEIERVQPELPMSRT